MPADLEPLQLEAFGTMHADLLQGSFFVDAGRAALAHHHRSPVPLRISGTATSDRTRLLHFYLPDPRHVRSFQRERIVEDGAIAMAGLVLALEDRRLLRVTRRGSHVDYFFGASNAKTTLGVVEISGTDRRSIETCYREKLIQARRSPYLERMSVLVAVTRFADPACRLERVTKEDTP
jgi:hypothetical protein